MSLRRHIFQINSFVMVDLSTGQRPSAAGFAHLQKEREKKKKGRKTLVLPFRTQPLQQQLVFTEGFPRCLTGFLVERGKLYHSTQSNCHLAP
ncbi:hypothetical protein AVEN_150358-1 [Araneus ventricosus]|uniref:Uncharacterized protein n=1 Tax=Araneus ventricosus TaxID=182803 RepID=A0A4Y2CQ33_ARAVE|nr:hypothetical protein AVEN_150358-1 [Araneus ventricosus]